jgi:DNA-directed RNA polymerases I, II, and III subunit RPABC1
MMQEQRVFRSIIVVKNNITPFAKTAIKEMAMRNYRMEYFRDAELLVRVTQIYFTYKYYLSLPIWHWVTA